MQLEAVNLITQWIPWLSGMILAGGTMAIAYFSVMKMGYFDEADGYNRKIITTLKAMIFILTITGTIELLKRYFIN